MCPMSCTGYIAGMSAYGLTNPGQVIEWHLNERKRSEKRAKGTTCRDVTRVRDEADIYVLRPPPVHGLCSGPQSLFKSAGSLQRQAGRLCSFSDHLIG